MRKETKICMSFNNLSLYRRSIYMKIDRDYDCDWYIENINTSVKAFPANELKRVYSLRVKKIGPFYWECGLLKLLWKDYDIYLMLGATRNIALFIFCVLKKIFFNKKKRIYFWTHGYYGKESRLELLFWKRPLFKLPDGLFTYGDYAKRIMVEDGFDENRIYPIHNSLDYDVQLNLRKTISPSNLFKDYFNNNYPILIFIGRLTPVKRLDMLIDAVTLLKRKGENYNIVFVGDGAERSSLENNVATNNLKNVVWFYGECYDEKENAELLYNADLCIAPGNVGLTSIHSMMFGCPVVSHNNYKLQMPEFEAIIPGLTGNFFEYGNVEDLSKTISEWFLKKGEQRETVRKACYEEIDTKWNPYYQTDILKQHLV